MTAIPQKELRNQIGDVLRRVEAGEEIVVTVSGRPVAQLSPVRRRRWVSGPELTQVWHGPSPRTLADDVAGLPADVADPFEQ